MNEQTPLLRLHDVSVSRGALARPSLAQFSLAIAPAETIAVLGEAGCGKEALVNVLGGYWERGEQVGGSYRCVMARRNAQENAIMAAFALHACLVLRPAR